MRPAEPAVRPASSNDSTEPPDARDTHAMARKRTATVSRPSKDLVIVNPPATPTRRRSSSIRRRPTRRRRSSRGSSVGGSSLKNQLIGTGLGGFLYGYVEKAFPNIPTIPVIGKSGTIAVACYFFGGKHPIIKDVGVAAAAIAGYSLGSTGKISGYEDD